MVQDNEDLFLADPLPQRPPGGDTTTHHAHLDNTIQSEMADRSVLYDEEELDNMAREQYEPVSIRHVIPIGIELDLFLFHSLKLYICAFFM